MDDLIFLGSYLREHLFPGGSVHIRNIGKEAALQLFHDVHDTARIVEINDGVRTAWNDRIDTWDLSGICLKISQGHRDSQFIGIGEQVQHRIGGTGDRHVKHHCIHQHLSGDQLGGLTSCLHKLCRVSACLPCPAEFGVVGCRSGGGAGEYQVQDFS